MARNPTNLLIGILQATTSPTPNLAVNTQIVASPGVSFRLRIWGVGITFNRVDITIIQKFKVQWRELVTPRSFWQQAIMVETSGSTHSLLDYFVGGYALPADAALTVTHLCSLASQSWWFQVQYTIEAA